MRNRGTDEGQDIWQGIGDRCGTGERTRDRRTDVGQKN